jgi:hypothetical protein
MPDTNGWPAGSPLSPPACSEWAKSQHLGPVGSAGHYEGFLLIEQPLPWPFDVASIPELAEAAELAVSAGLRVQTVVPVDSQVVSVDGQAAPVPARADGGAGGDPAEGRPPLAPAGPTRRLVCYRSQRPGWAGPLVRSERTVEAGSLAEVAAELINEGPAVKTPADEGPEVIDLLVCTHGRRDACCGARGMELVSELSGHSLLGPGTGVRLWRTSHTGGHRFAPTAIVLPAGTMWAWADPALLRAAALGEGEVWPWIDRYRGCATVGSPAQQAVERAVLAEVGWDLLGALRKVSDLGDGIVRLESELGGTWEAAVREGRRVPQPDCRTPPELAKKQSVEWVVEGLRLVVPA